MADIASDTGFSGVQTNLKARTRHLNEHQLEDVFRVPDDMEEDTVKNCYVPTAAGGELNLRVDYSVFRLSC